MPPASISACIRASGGFATAADLRRAGVSRDMLAGALARGEIFRVRRGIYGLPSSDPLVTRAVRVGGALASISAAGKLGIWMPPHDSLHVSVAADAHHLKSPDDARTSLATHHPVTLLRDGHHRDPRRERWIVSPTTCLAQAVRSQPTEFAVAMIDSALLERRENGIHIPPIITESELDLVRSLTPVHLHEAFEYANGLAEAGSESVARVRLLVAGILARAQVDVAAGIRVDLLIGDRLVVEIGSQAHHTGATAYERDHERLAILAGLGFMVLDFTYWQVMDDWETVIAVICAAMERGEHLSRTRMSAAR